MIKVNAYWRESTTKVTKWKKFKMAVVWYFKRTLATSGISFLAIATMLFFYEAGRHDRVIRVSATETDSLPARLEIIKDNLLTKLSVACEIKGRKPSDGNIIFDSNKLPSIGEFMFQIKTVQHYYQTIYGKKITGQEAIAIANDSIKSRELAKAIIFDTEAGVSKDWVNCSKWHNLQAEVDLIKKLSK